MVNLATSLASDLAELVQSMNLGGNTSEQLRSSSSSNDATDNANRSTPPPPKRLFSEPAQVIQRFSINIFQKISYSTPDVTSEL